MSETLLTDSLKRDAIIYAAAFRKTLLLLCSDSSSYSDKWETIPTPFEWGSVQIFRTRHSLSRLDAKAASLIRDIAQGRSVHRIDVLDKTNFDHLYVSDYFTWETG